MTDDSNPSISFCGLDVFAERDGDRVTGRVVFPYECNGRTECPIDYRSLRTDSAIPGSQGQKVKSQKSRPSDLRPSDLRPSTFDLPHSTLDDKARKRLELVEQWHNLCDKNPEAGKTVFAQRVAEAGGVSVRSLQSWAGKLDVEGPAGLRDHYVPAPKKVLALNHEQAQFCVMVCAWWAFRIGNCECIGTKMMHVAVAQLIEPGYLVADIVATIDCCYSWKCDRTKYRFKPFARWAKHDFPAPWLYRACNENDYRRGLQAARNGQVPLQPPRTTMSSAIADPRTRKREVLHGPTRRAIRDLAPASAIPRSQGQKVKSQKSKVERSKGIKSRSSDLRPSTCDLSEPPSNPLQVAGMFKSFGLHGAATRVIQAAAPGIPALAANENPQTIAEALGTLDDGYRGMLNRAAHGDREARKQAIATMPLWWGAMPRGVRDNIEFMVDAWRKEHPRTATDYAVNRRKLYMLLPDLRSEHTGAQQLCPAARIPV